MARVRKCMRGWAPLPPYNADLDDLEGWPTEMKASYKLIPFFTVTALAASFTYFGYRIYCRLEIQKSLGKTFPVAWVFTIVQTSVAFPQLFYTFYPFLSLRNRTKPKLQLHGDAVPLVDVFVTCCKEDINVILDTTGDACAVYYPQDRYQVIFCDDGADLCWKMRSKRFEHFIRISSTDPDVRSKENFIISRQAASSQQQKWWCICPSDIVNLLLLWTQIWYHNFTGSKRLRHIWSLTTICQLFANPRYSKTYQRVARFTRA